MWLDFCILLITVFLDTQINFAAWGMPWPLQSSFFFLFFIFAKRSRRESFVVGMAFLFFAKIFSTMELWPLLTAYAFTGVLVYFIRKRIITETFLFEALWASGLFFLFLIIQFAVYDFSAMKLFLAQQGLRLGLYSLLHFVLAFFMLLILDRLYGFVWSKRRLS